MGDPWPGTGRPAAYGRLRWLARAVAWAVVVPSHRGDLAEAQKLAGHSIERVPDINALASDWFLAGTVIPSLRSLVLNPGTARRGGMLWSQTPLLTNDFEVTMSLTVQGPKDASAVRDDGFAFWIANENGTAVHADLSVQHLHNQDAIIAGSWEKAFLAQDLDLLYYRSKFNGLGVFFVDDAKTQKSSVSAIVNDGSKSLKLQTDIPSADAIKVDFRSGFEVTVKLRVQPQSAKLEVLGHGSVELKGDFKPGGYLGFTSFGGTGPKAAFVELRRLEVQNHDRAARGEEVRAPAPPPPTKRPEDREDVFGAASAHRDHREESEAIKDLTNLVFKLLVETQPVRAQMRRAVQSLQKRVEAMEKSFQELSKEMEKKAGHKLAEEFESIKRELSTLSSVATKDSEERHKRLGDLHADISHVHKVAQSSESIDKHLEQLTESHSKVLDQLTTEHQTMFGVSLVAIGFVLVAGFSLYNKFRCWEKKHVL